MENETYDLIIIGAGPAGLGASIYASRYKLNHLVIGAEMGGQAVNAWQVENYPGYEKISGRDLTEKFRIQAENLGGKIIQGVVGGVKKNNGEFEVFTEDGKSHKSQSIILALGMKPRKLNIPGEDKFVGKGVSYCATCDAAFFRGKDVVVIGGGDAAATAALHVAEFASKVYVLYRDNYIFEPVWEEQIKKNPKIELVCCSNVAEIKGDQKVTAVSYEFQGAKKELPAQGVFIEIGSVPGVAIAKELGIETDEQGYIIVDRTQATNIENVFAAGDVTTGSNKFRQIITAVAEGAVAAGSTYKKLKLKR
ncbi:MAG: FAD-dependent oxidoreductase [Candidatus Moranbacteria bacterium]|nr:FAD-dependent oxidoreductase [Candidatus Moranbacteria bacterium]